MDGTVTELRPDQKRGDQIIPRERQSQAIQHLDEPTRAVARRAGKVTQAKRRHDVLALAVQGATSEEIAETLTESYKKQGLAGITKHAVEKILSKALTEWRESDLAKIENVRALQKKRIEEVMGVVLQKAQDGSLKAMDRYTRLEALLAKISGTEAPRRLEVSGSVGHHLEETKRDAQREEEAWAVAGASERPAIPATATEADVGT